MTRVARDPSPISRGNPRAGELCAARCIHPEVVASAQARLADGAIYRTVAELFGALADPTRAKLVHALVRHELCTCDLADVLGISESAVSQHLRILRALRLVKARRQGKFVFYTLDDAHVALLLQLGLTHAGHTEEAEKTGGPHVGAAAGA